ncbi:MAG: 4a-hydroxytetrahydrobiopterin dehydratase [Bacteroidota bacterium]|nr:4a-hydroxytetrahydrobiopterin dehydratase [Bacteroidota bacterium]
MNNIDWTIEGNFMNKDFDFQSSKSAISFMDEIAKIADVEQHHPEIHFHSGKTVNIRIRIESEKGISEKDIRLANLINNIG